MPRSCMWHALTSTLYISKLPGLLLGQACIDVVLVLLGCCAAGTHLHISCTLQGKQPLLLGLHLTSKDLHRTEGTQEGGLSASQVLPSARACMPDDPGKNLGPPQQLKKQAGAEQRVHLVYTLVHTSSLRASSSRAIMCAADCARISASGATSCIADTQITNTFMPCQVHCITQC